MPAFPNPLAEYIEQFSAIVDQLGAYHRTTDPLFYTMRFIDGFSLHRPPKLGYCLCPCTIVGGPERAAEAGGSQVGRIV